jgi:hypothetical protein
MAESDWDLGQRLIEQGICTLDQVREAISIQDRMKRMGIVPKPLPQILLEKRYARPEQLAAAGVAVEVPQARPAPSRPSAARRLERRPSRRPVVALVFAAAAVGLVLLLWPHIREGLSTGSRRPAPGPSEPGPTAEERSDREARDELEAIAEFQRSDGDFEKSGEVVRRYEGYMRKHGGRRWELEANRRLREYRERAEGFARPFLAEIEKRDAELRARERFGELLALYQAFPAKFLAVTESGRAVRERIAELGRRVREHYVAEKAAVEKLHAERKFEAAMDRLRALELVAPEENLKDLSELRGRIDREWKVTTAKVRLEVADAYLTRVDGPFRQALGRRDVRGAAGKVAEFLWAPWTEEQRPFARPKGPDYDLLRKAIDEWKPEAVVLVCEPSVPDVDAPDKLTTGEGALLDLRNAALVALFIEDSQAAYRKAVASKEKLEMPSLGTGHFERRADKTVFIGADGKPAEAPLGEPDLVYLAMRGREKEAAAHARAGFFCYTSEQGQPKLAYDHLAEAQRLGARRVKVYLATAFASAQAEMARLLEIKFESAVESMKKRQRETARKLLGEMLENPDHPYTKAKRPEIERMLFDIAEGTTKEKELAVRYKGRGETLEAGAVRVTYDFEGKEQIDAFELVTEEGARKFRGRWRIEKGALESSTEASVALWKTPVAGDVAVEFELTPLEDPQNIVLDLYYARGQSRHYAVVFGFDWLGRADGDPANVIEDKMGMPRTCILKYPVAVDKMRAVLAEHWENWTSRLVGRGAGTWKPPRGKPTRVRVAREGKAVRLLADGAVLTEGEDADYTRGSLLFFSDSRCRIDNLAIAFKP